MTPEFSVSRILCENYSPLSGKGLILSGFRMLMTPLPSGKTMGDWNRRCRTKALTREISPRFTHALANYYGSGPTNLDASRTTHEEYITALKNHGLEVRTLPGLSEYPDCCFVEDAAVVVDGAVVMCNLGHPSRRGEVEGIRNALNGALEVIHMPEDAHLDGGDVLFYDDLFMIGRSTRTNDAGIEFIRGVMDERGFASVVMDVPSTTLHLSTVCSSPAPGVLVAAEGFFTPEQLAPLGGDIIWVPHEESYGANTIGFEGDRVIVSSDYPQTSAALIEHGFSLTEVDMEHIRAADGSLTCLRLFYA